MPIVPAVATLSAVLFTAWFVVGTLLARAIRQVAVFEEAAGAGAESGPLPSLSVVVTARNEADEIDRTVRRLLAQRYPDLRIVVVDDRSTDGTGEILDRLRADADASRLEVVHVRELPPGWLGKCHACHQGSARVRADWILFLDGDVELVGDDLLARAVALAERDRLDHLAIIPDQRPLSSLQQALVSVFGQAYLLSARVYEMDQDRRTGGVGIGAFNLVRRAAYDRVGGHALLKMDPADDYKLGCLLKESGARQRLFDGVGRVRCRWHRGVLNVARGLEKNLFSAFDYSILKLSLTTLLAVLLVFGPAALGIAAPRFLAPAAGRGVLRVVAWLPLLLQTAFLVAGFRKQAQRYGGSPALLSLLYPVAALILVGAAWNSALRTIARGGIRWRDTFYRLADLRAGRVRTGAGQRPGML